MEEKGSLFTVFAIPKLTFGGAFFQLEKTFQVNLVAKAKKWSFRNEDIRGFSWNPE